MLPGSGVSWLPAHTGHRKEGINLIPENGWMPRFDGHDGRVPAGDIIINAMAIQEYLHVLNAHGAQLQKLANLVRERADEGRALHVCAVVIRSKTCQQAGEAPQQPLPRCRQTALGSCRARRQRPCCRLAVPGKHRAAPSPSRRALQPEDIATFVRPANGKSGVAIRAACAVRSRQNDDTGVYATLTRKVCLIRHCSFASMMSRRSGCWSSAP